MLVIVHYLAEQLTRFNLKCTSLSVYAFITQNYANIKQVFIIPLYCKEHLKQQEFYNISINIATNIVYIYIMLALTLYLIRLACRLKI